MAASPSFQQPPRPFDPFAEDRARVLACAREWIGTPFLDCASVKGAGVDCAAFVRESFAAAGLDAPVMPQYSPQWYMNGDRDLWMSHIDALGVEIKQEQAKAADLVVYKFGRYFSHGALVITWPRIIHAYRQSRCVLEDRGDAGMLARVERRFFTRKAWA